MASFIRQVSAPVQVSTPAASSMRGPSRGMALKPDINYCAVRSLARPQVSTSPISQTIPCAPRRTSRAVVCTAAKAAVAAAAAPAAAGAGAAASEIFAQGLGYAILFGACFRSMPQIKRIIDEKSVEGLSVTAFTTELLCLSVTVAYNMSNGYPFSQFGDVVACWIQDIILMGLFGYFLKPPPAVLVGATLAFVAYAGFLFGGLASVEVLQWMQGATIVVFALGNSLPQIWLNYTRGNTGVLSLTTAILNVAGCAARVFTTVVLTKDILIGTGFSIQLVLNGILAYQCWMTAKAAKDIDAPPKAEPA